VAKRTREGGEIEVDLMTEVEEARPRGLRRMSPFGEIGMESELAELGGGRAAILPSAAVAVTEREEEVVGDDTSDDTDTETETETAVGVGVAVVDDDVDDPLVVGFPSPISKADDAEDDA